MRLIIVEAIPNQSFTVRLDDAQFDITIKETRGVMSATIIRDNVTLIENSRITAGTPILPYKYQERGNFVMITENEAIPYYDQFGNTQHLIYVEAAEVEAYRGGA